MVDKDMTIAEVLELNRGTALVLMNAGMHCVGCPSSAGETLEEASMVHGIEVNTLVDEINNFLQSV